MCDNEQTMFEVAHRLNDSLLEQAMTMTVRRQLRHFRKNLWLLAVAMLFIPFSASAVPSFARQTGQNCVACHVGGQFPELTPYGRKFKLTGYTIGEQAMPLSVMAVASINKTRNRSDPTGDAVADFPKDGVPIFSTASVFFAGKLSDKLGAFVQVTYNNYDSQSSSDSHWKGHTTSDNLDVRYADHFVYPNSDLIVCATLNNNPTVQDVWNSVPAWGYNTAPGSSGPATTPLIAGGIAQQAMGLGAYALWNDTLYGELSLYQTANGVWSIMSQGLNTDLGSQQILKGFNPYWRLALTHEWGAHNGMIGLFGMETNIYPNATDPTGPTNKYNDVGIDGQYQYILDPHTFTAQASVIRERIHWTANGLYPVANQAGAYDSANGTALQTPTNASDTLRIFRAKASYTYEAMYGGSLSFFDVRGSSNSLNQTNVFDPAIGGVGGTSVGGNLSGNPGSRAWTSEVFWTPIQYMRLGLQYTDFIKFNGAANNYDGFGRNAKDNNTIFVYLWAAY